MAPGRVLEPRTEHLAPAFDTAMTVTDEIPIFPLSSPLYPDGRLALRIFEQRYVDMTKACIADEAPFGVALIKGGFEVGQPAIPHAIGCSARIVEWEVPSPGLFRLETRGERRFRLLDRRTRGDGLILGRVEWLDPLPPLPVPSKHEPLALLLRRLIDEIGAEHFPAPRQLNDAAWVAYRLAEVLPVTPERKQALLELDDPALMLAQVERLIADLQDEGS